jgi:hypothetical protein
MSATRGRWHGPNYTFGLHYDLHANTGDTELGARCGLKDLVPMLRLMAPDFVQTDCKGHPGMTSWFSKIPGATVAPGVVKDALAQWRAATRRLGMPLHAHYSGVWDIAAGRKHPGWCARDQDDKPQGAVFGPGRKGRPAGERMCRLGPYVDKLLIPQFLELIERYGLDGFWVDGDIWATEPCYCPRCRRAFARVSGRATPPKDEADPAWPEWVRFTRETYYDYVTRYCDAVHARKPGVLVCSNWLQTFRNPGEPRVPTDWISGDNSWVWGLDDSRCEARFISTRGKPWDIMLWNFYCSHGMGKPDSPWVAKPVEMIQQEAAVTLAFGGGVQVYENPPGLRNGQLIPWRQKRMRAVGRFVRARRRICRGTSTLPQVAVLHSEAHLYSKPGRNLFWGLDTQPVRGAVFSLLEGHYGVDILDEWALLPRLREFPVVVAPEQDRMSDAMAAALKRYVEEGGRLLVTGSAAFDRFGAAFLGATFAAVEKDKTYHVPAADGAAPLFSAEWRLLTPVDARPLGRLGTTPLRDERLLPNPAAVIRKVGRGRVGYIPCSVFRDFAHNRYPLTRAFILEVVRAVAGRTAIEVEGPVCVDVVLRQKDQVAYVHFINRASGIPNNAHNGAIDEIPAVGPLTVRMRLKARPASVSLEFEPAPVRATFKPGRSGGVLTVTVPRVRIHTALVVK